MERKIVYAKNINGDSELTGLVDISKNPPEVYCFCTEEVAEEILVMKNQSRLYDELDEEVGKFYTEDNSDEDLEDGGLSSIGEITAIKLGYL